MPGANIRRFTLADLHRMPDGPTLSVREVSAIWGLPEEVVRRRMRNQEIRSVRVGQNYKVPWRALRAYCIRTRLVPLRGLA